MLVNRSRSDCLRVAAVPRDALLTACARYGIREVGRGGKTGAFNRTEKLTYK
jgi:hypothetical protein